MITKTYEELGETLFFTTLPNGLNILVVPKPGFSRKIAYFATNFGSLHTHFLLNGEEYHMPNGIAHFLEHKMFDLPQRDVSAEFAALGANVNAFTSYDMTAYYVSCTRHFEQCLGLLLEFVSTPYFTEETIQREIGIIDQEIAMNEDDPLSREFELLMGGMYRRHPVRIPILGTRESIRQITKEDLALCHRAFYTPANMTLCVVGDVSAEAVATIAEEVLGREYLPPAEKIRNWDEEMNCPASRARQSMDVALPSYQIGFKCDPIGPEDHPLRVDLIGYLAAEMLLGESTELYLQLYEKGVIDSSFGGSFETIDGCAMLTCGADGDECEEVLQTLLQRSAQIAKEGLDEEEFLRLKRGVVGRRIRELDNFDALCFRICAYHMLGIDYLHFPAIYGSIGIDEVTAFLKTVITPQRCSMVLTLPLEESTSP